jgi:6,7-dimethyl-8-ribityllumazine synthase
MPKLSHPAVTAFKHNVTTMLEASAEKHLSALGGSEARIVRTTPNSIEIICRVDDLATSSHFRIVVAECYPTNNRRLKRAR